MTPSHIGRYEIQRRLGAGGMGALFLARDPALDRLVALKLVKEEYQEDAELRERFVREARSVARLRHRNIIIIYEIGEADNRPFIAMEYIAGETLTNVLRRTPPPPLTARLAMVEELCDGLAHAHAAGIIHRDIKPANVMVDAEGVVKILDFGIARLDDSGITQAGMMMGTVNYMSPEQVLGNRVDRRTDIFAAGAVMYELIALEQCFPGRIDSGVLHRILEQGPVPLNEKVRGVDSELVRIVNHALDREPTERYQDVNVMRADVARVRQRLLAQERDLRARPPRTQQAEDRSSDRKRLDPGRAAELRRQHVDEHLRFGEEAFARGEHDAALQYAERAATVDPESRQADDLIDRARSAIEAKALRQLLAEADRLLSEGQLDDAAALAEEASVTMPDFRSAPGLLEEVRKVSDRIAAARDRERRIVSSLERARSSIEQGGYDTALRAVYEVLALDPERREARELEERAKSSLQAQRELESARRTAYDHLKAARGLANEGKYDEAIDAINAVILPSHSVRIAAAETLDIVRKQQRQAVQAAIMIRARAAFDEAQYEQAIRILDSIPVDEHAADVRSLRSAAEHAVSTQRELEQKRHMLDAALADVAAWIDRGDLAGALERLDEAGRIGIEDGRIPALRQKIADLEVAAQEKRRQEARDRLVAKKVDAARQLLAKGDAYAALAVLDRDGSGHPLVEDTLREIRAAIAEQEERVRQETERRRQEEEARRRAEAEAARRREERRKAEEQQRRQEVAALLARVDEALTAQRPDDAMLLLERADGVGRIEGDTALARRMAAAKVEVDRQRRVREEEARAREEEARRRREEEARRQAELRQREDALTKVLTRARHAAAHEEALDLLNEALTLVPGDARVQALIRQRSEALEREREETRQREEARRQKEEARRRQEEQRRQELEAARLAEARRAEEVKRAAEMEAARLREEQQRAAAAVRQQEAARQREEARTEVHTQARKQDAHDVAQTLSKQAHTTAPDDPRVETQIGQRDAAMKSQLADDQRRAREEAALVRESVWESERTEPEGVSVSVPPPTVVQQKAGHVPAQPGRASSRVPVAAGIGIAILALSGGLAYWMRTPAEPADTVPPKSPPQVVEPAPDPPVKTGASIEEQVRGHLDRARALLSSGQQPAALAAVQAALALKGDDSNAVALRDQMLRDATTASQRAKQGAVESRADRVAAATYGQALALERSAQRERQAGRIAQALPLLWDARAQFLAATEEARKADQAGREQTARDQSAREQAARDQAARDQTARDQAAKEQAARDQTARDQATKEQAARDQAREQALRDQAAREQAARDQAARDQVRQQQLDENAVTQTIRDYEAAFTRLDADAVARVLVLTGPQLAELRKSLTGARAYNISVQIRETKFGADRRQAVVTANVSRTYVPVSGNTQRSSLAQNFVMEKRGDSWLIVAVR